MSSASSHFPSRTMHCAARYRHASEVSTRRPVREAVLLLGSDVRIFSAWANWCVRKWICASQNASSGLPADKRVRQHTRRGISVTGRMRTGHSVDFAAPELGRVVQVLRHGVVPPAAHPVDSGPVGCRLGLMSRGFCVVVVVVFVARVLYTEREGRPRCWRSPPRCSGALARRGSTLWRERQGTQVGLPPERVELVEAQTRRARTADIVAFACGRCAEAEPRRRPEAVTRRRGGGRVERGRRRATLRGRERSSGRHGLGTSVCYSDPATKLIEDSMPRAERLRGGPSALQIRRSLST